MDTKLFKELFAAASHGRAQAYAPYSRFLVGAALRTKKGKIFTGCNVENASFGATICAERVAFVKAICEGEREFSDILVIHSGGEDAAPCGLCRQVIFEFAPDMTVTWTDPKGEKAKSYSIKELFPHAFGPQDL